MFTLGAPCEKNEKNALSFSPDFVIVVTTVTHKQILGCLFTV